MWRDTIGDHAVLGLTAAIGLGFVVLGLLAPVP